MRPNRLAALTLFLASAAAQAQTTGITSAQQFGTPQGTVSWGQFGPSKTVVDNGAAFTITGLSGITGTVSEASFHFQRRDQGPDWGGDFLPGTQLLWTVGNNGPMTFDFSSAIYAFGTQVQSDFAGNGTAEIDIFSHNVYLGSQQFYIHSGDAADGSANFVGISSTLAFDRVVLVAGTTYGGADFAVNEVLLDAGGEDADTVAPEPGALVLSATGLLVLGGFRRRRS